MTWFAESLIQGSQQLNRARTLTTPPVHNHIALNPSADIQINVSLVQ